MSGRSLRNQETQRAEASLDLQTNNDQASSWGNGLMAGMTHNQENTSTPGIADSFYGISQDLAMSGPGYGPRTDGRTATDWMSGGMGGAYGGDITGDQSFWSGGMGMGLGGGGGSWEQQGTNLGHGWERSASGYGGGVAMGGRVDSTMGYDTGENFETLYAGGDMYRGLGANGYAFNDTNAETGQSRSGYGVDANYTPFGVNNASAAYANNYMDGQVSAGNMAFGQRGGHLEGYQTSDGGYGLQGGLNMGRNTATDLQGSLNSPLGNTNASVGSISQGRYYEGGIETSPDGSVMGNVSRGGALTIENAAISNDGPLGYQEASLGRYGGISPTQISGGYNATENQAQANFNHGQGWAVDNASAYTTLPGGGDAGVQVGHVENGWRADGSGYFDFDDNSAHLEGNYSGGGVTARDITGGYGWDGMRTDFSVGEIGNANTVTGANLDYADGQLDARVEQARWGGAGMTDFRAEQELFGMNTTASLDEVSNDHRLDGAHFTANGDGISGGFDEYDGGGIRVTNAAYTNDLGGYGNVDAGLGSFGNGNNIQGAEFNVDGDGLTAGVREFGVAGTDVRNAHVNVEGPGGSHLNASLGSYHSGVTGRNVQATVNGDGVGLRAEQLGYDQHQIENLNLSSGFGDGMYEQNFSVGEAHMNQARISNLDAGMDMDGNAHLSMGPSSYSYLGASDVHASQSYMNGAVGTEANIGDASYLGGSVENASFQSNFLEGTSSSHIEGLNVHGLTANDVNVGANVGDARAEVGFDHLGVLDASVGEIQTQSSNYGLTQDMRMTDANLDVVNAQNVGGALSYGDQRLLEARADVDLSAGADVVEGSFDATQGTASGQIRGGRLDATTDMRVGIGDYDIDLGRTGVNGRMDAAGAVDLSEGTASGNVNFAGSELHMGPLGSVEIGEWAQASADVDLSEMALRTNIGGENGIGTDINLSEGQVHANLFGHEIDIDQAATDTVEAVGDAAEWVGDTAMEVGGAVVDGVSDAASWVGDTASDVGSSIADGASSAWDAVTSW